MSLRTPTLRRISRGSRPVDRPIRSSRTIGAKHSSGNDTVSMSLASPLSGKGTVCVRAPSEATPAESWQTMRARRSGDGLKPRSGIIRPSVLMKILASPFPSRSSKTLPRSIVHVTTDDGNPAITWFATFPSSEDEKGCGGLHGGRCRDPEEERDAYEGKNRLHDCCLLSSSRLLPAKGGYPVARICSQYTDLLKDCSGMPYKAGTPREIS